MLYKSPCSPDSPSIKSKIIFNLALYLNIESIRISKLNLQKYHRRVFEFGLHGQGETLHHVLHFFYINLTLILIYHWCLCFI